MNYYCKYQTFASTYSCLVRHAEAGTKVTSTENTSCFALWPYHSTNDCLHPKSRRVRSTLIPNMSTHGNLSTHLVANACSPNNQVLIARRGVEASAILLRPCARVDDLQQARSDVTAVRRVSSTQPTLTEGEPTSNSTHLYH
jgi:hypothetical protein